MSTCGARGSQKRVLDPVELELQMAVSHQWVLGSEFRLGAKGVCVCR